MCAATNYTLKAGYLSQLERRPYNISFAILDSICKALEVPMVDMIREIEGGEAVQFDEGGIPIRDVNGDKTGDFLPKFADSSNSIYAFKMLNDSMESPTGAGYFQGGYLIITAADKLESNKDYIFRVDEKLIPGRYKTDGRRHFIHYLNTQWGHEVFSEPLDVKGKIIGFTYFLN